jgi:uncharacterized protein YegJ (DUF2314 family)
VHRPGEPDVVFFEDDDPDMAAAIERARASFPGFQAKLAELRARGDYYSIKVPVDADANTEHVWLEGAEILEGRVRGKLGNALLAGPHKLGDEVTVPVESISDWMAVVGGDLYGGYTVIVARARMSEEERAQFDRSVDFRVPESARVFREPQ